MPQLSRILNDFSHLKFRVLFNASLVDGRMA
jgi:hypothetical protein